MKTKHFLLSLLALLVSVSASAYDAEIDGIYYNFSDGKAIVTYRDHSYKSYSGSVVIPESVTHNGTTYSVTSIGNEAFRDCSGLTSVTIPESVTSIGYGAFSSCRGLTSVTIPNSVTIIGYQAFSGCSGLTSVTIPNSVTSIDDQAFSGCRGLTSVTIPSSVTSIGNYAFRYCTNLASVTIPSSVTSIGSSAFYGCYFAGSSFVNNSTLTSNNNWGARLFDEETSDGLLIEDNVVKTCRDWVVSVTIPDGVEAIGESALYYRNTLTSVTIPGSVTSIGNNAFYQCKNLKNVNISNGLTSIGKEAFRDCSVLSSITIPESVTSIGSSAFYGCYFQTESFVNNTTLTSSNYWGATLCDEETSDGLMIRDNSVIKCRTWATSVTIPNSVTSIGGSAFYQCSNLTSITIPDGVTSIGYYAFYGCSGLTSVSIPESVTSIGNSAFDGCRGLTSLTIPNSVTSIGERAFEYCSGLTSVTIPNSVTSIGNYAFNGCRSLTSVTIPANVTTIGENVFRECKGLSTVNIKCSQVGTLMFYECSSLSTLNLGSNVTTIGESAFGLCSALTSLHIPQNVSSIGERAFQGCNIETITVEDGNTVYDSRDNCNAIIQTSYNRLVVGCKNTTIPETVKSIGNYAFLSLNLSEIIIPDNVVSIRKGAFAGTTINHIVIPASVTSIGGGCFSSAKIVLIEFPYSETEINYDSDEGSLFAYTEIGTLINDRTLEMYDWCSHDCGAFSEAKIDKVIAGPHAFATFRYSTITDYYWPKEKTLVYQSYSFYSYGNNSFRGGGNSTVKYLHLPKGVTTIDKVFSADTIDIPASVTSIKDEAFECYPKKVYMYKRTPLAISASTFKGRSSTTLYVPRGCKAAYEAADYWKEFKEIIEMDVPIEEYVLFDETSSSPVIEDIYAKADLKRTFAEGWNTICLPFAIDNIEAAFGTGAKAYGFDDFADGELKFSLVTTLTAGVPYVIYVPAEITDLIAFENITIEDANITGSSIDKNGVFFRGTYAPIAAGEWTKANSTDDIYGLTADGRIRKAGAEASILGFRGYFDIPAGTEVKGFVFGGGATGIDDIEHSSLTIDHSIYNLAGQRLNKAQKGINIINGKKILK